MRRTSDALGLTDYNQTGVTMRVQGDAKLTTVWMEASRNGVTAALNISLDTDSVDALYDELTYLRSLRGL